MYTKKLKMITCLVLTMAMGASEFAFGQSCLTNTTPQPVTVNPGVDTDDESWPELVTDGLGTWFASWDSDDDMDGTIGADSDILFSRSVDNGTSWSVPVAFNANAASDNGRDEAMRMAADGLGHWVAVWVSEDDLEGIAVETIGTDLDILVIRSDDNGVTWSPIAALNSNAVSDTGYDIGPDLTTDGMGTWIVTWNSNDDLGETIGVDVDILFSRSTDNGATWSVAAALDNTADSDGGLDTWVKLAADRAGHWVAAWESYNDPDGGIRLVVSQSADYGVNWTDPKPLNTNAASESGPDLWIDLATDSLGNWVAVWTYFDNLPWPIGFGWSTRVSRSTDLGETWSAPVELQGNPGSISLIEAAPAPHITTDGQGNWVAAWGSQDDSAGMGEIDWDIMISGSTDAGATWNEPVPLNSNASSDSGLDAFPRLATDRMGNWVAAWSFDDGVGERYRYDDILVTRFHLDMDGDGIRDSVDDVPDLFSNSFVDNSTTPSTRGGFANRGDQDLCASDAPIPDGVRIESLSGGSTPAIVQVLCFGSGFDMDVGNLSAGECITVTCRPGPVAKLSNGCSAALTGGSAAGADVQAAAVGDVDVSLLANGLVVGTVVLPDGNTITYDPQTREVTASTSNNATLTVVPTSGDPLPLPPGGSVTVPSGSGIPAASVWGLTVFALVLLVGAKVYFERHRLVPAAAVDHA